MARQRHQRAERNATVDATVSYLRPGEARGQQCDTECHLQYQLSMRHFPVCNWHNHSELLCFVQMKVYTQRRTEEILTVPQRFSLGCVSGAVAHAVFYPLEVSEISGRSECFNVSVLSCVLSEQQNIVKTWLITIFLNDGMPLPN